MKIYEKPGEVRITLDHRPLETVRGTVTVDLYASTASVKFTPHGQRHRKEWRWLASRAGRMRAAIYSGGEQLADIDLGYDGGWIAIGEEMRITW